MNKNNKEADKLIKDTVNKKEDKKVREETPVKESSSQKKESKNIRYIPTISTKLTTVGNNTVSEKVIDSDSFEKVNIRTKKGKEKIETFKKEEEKILQKKRDKVAQENKIIDIARQRHVERKTSAHPNAEKEKIISNLKQIKGNVEIVRKNEKENLPLMSKEDAEVQAALIFPYKTMDEKPREILKELPKVKEGNGKAKHNTVKKNTNKDYKFSEVKDSTLTRIVKKTLKERGISDRNYKEKIATNTGLKYMSQLEIALDDYINTATKDVKVIGDNGDEEVVPNTVGQANVLNVAGTLIENPNLAKEYSKNKKDSSIVNLDNGMKIDASQLAYNALNPYAIYEYDSSPSTPNFLSGMNADAAWKLRKGTVNKYNRDLIHENIVPKIIGKAPKDSTIPFVHMINKKFKIADGSVKEATYADTKNSIGIAPIINQAINQYAAYDNSSTSSKQEKEYSKDFVDKDFNSYSLFDTDLNSTIGNIIDTEKINDSIKYDKYNKITSITKQLVNSPNKLEKLTGLAKKISSIKSYDDTVKSIKNELIDSNMTINEFKKDLNSKVELVTKKDEQTGEYKTFVVNTPGEDIIAKKLSNEKGKLASDSDELVSPVKVTMFPNVGPTQPYSSAEGAYTSASMINGNNVSTESISQKDVINYKKKYGIEVTPQTGAVNDYMDYYHIPYSLADSLGEKAGKIVNHFAQGDSKWNDAQKWLKLNAIENGVDAFGNMSYLPSNHYIKTVGTVRGSIDRLYEFFDRDLKQNLKYIKQEGMNTADFAVNSILNLANITDKNTIQGYITNSRIKKRYRTDKAAKIANEEQVNKYRNETESNLGKVANLKKQGENYKFANAGQGDTGSVSYDMAKQVNNPRKNISVENSFAANSILRLDKPVLIQGKSYPGTITQKTYLSLPGDKNGVESAVEVPTVGNNIDLEASRADKKLYEISDLTNPSLVKKISRKELKDLIAKGDVETDDVAYRQAITDMLQPDNYDESNYINLLNLYNIGNKSTYSPSTAWNDKSDEDDKSSIEEITNDTTNINDKVDNIKSLQDYLLPLLDMFEGEEGQIKLPFTLNDKAYYKNLVATSKLVPGSQEIKNINSYYYDNNPIKLNVSVDSKLKNAMYSFKKVQDNPKLLNKVVQRINDMVYGNRLESYNYDIDKYNKEMKITADATLSNLKAMYRKASLLMASNMNPIVKKVLEKIAGSKILSYLKTTKDNLPNKPVVPEKEIADKMDIETKLNTFFKSLGLTNDQMSILKAFSDKKDFSDVIFTDGNNNTVGTIGFKQTDDKVPATNNVYTDYQRQNDIEKQSPVMHISNIQYPGSTLPRVPNVPREVVANWLYGNNKHNAIFTDNAKKAVYMYNLLGKNNAFIQKWNDLIEAGQVKWGRNNDDTVLDSLLPTAKWNPLTKEDIDVIEKELEEEKKKEENK